MAVAAKTTPVTFKHSLFVKLNNENHLLWKQQVIAAVRGHKLMHFLYSSSTPQRYLSVQDEEKPHQYRILNKEQQDQLLISWLLSYMTETSLTRVVDCESAYEIWTKLNTNFAA